MVFVVVAAGDCGGDDEVIELLMAVSTIPLLQQNYMDNLCMKLVLLIAS